MKLLFLSHSKSLDQNLSSSPPWTWPGCANINTLSFRASDTKDTTFRTFNSLFIDTQITPPDSFFTSCSSSRSDSSVISDDQSDPVESFIRSLRSDRLFFDPDQSCSLVSVANGGDGQGCLGVKDNETTITSNNLICMQSLALSRNEVGKEEEPDDDNKEISITDKKERCTQTLPLSRDCRKKKEGEEKEKEVYKESEILSTESKNPYEDFRRSMEEMVEAHGLKDWQGLEELLDCYLKINEEQNHGFIVDAFIDLLVSLSISSNTSILMTSSSSSSNATSSSSSLLSSISSPSSLLSLPSSSPCLYPIFDDGGDDESR